jgi:2-isopropylmalate synthase
MVKARLLSLGYTEIEFENKKVFDKFKALADKKGTIYDDDLVALMESKSNDDLVDFYTLEYLNVSSGRGTVPTATARICAAGKVFQEAACGDGAVDAATKAIDRIVGYQITIENYHLEAVTEGRDALGRVSIVARSEEGVFTGGGTSTDIVEASALAYMDIINKITRMKKFNRKLPVFDKESL